MAKGKKGGDGGFEFAPQCFTATLEVYPQIAMIRENALRLATNLAAHHELTDIHMSDEVWKFARPQARQGQPRGLIQVSVEGQEIAIEHRFPASGLERFEILVEQVIDSIEPVIKPQVLLETVVSLEYVVDMGSDSRKTILGALNMIGDEEDESKLAVFDRPCHFVGLRLGFPAFHLTEETSEEEGGKEGGSQELVEEAPDTEGKEKEPFRKEETTEGADWHATLTLQSLLDEPSKLSVQVEGRWTVPSQWAEVAKTMANRLKTVDDFLRTKTKEFLKHFRSES